MEWAVPSAKKLARTNSWQEKRKDRTTLTLSNPALLRGVTTSTLLGHYGSRLRSTAGGIGFVKPIQEDEFENSFQTQELDYFLSHSWHASWLSKYLALLFYFNLVPAAIGASIVGAGAAWMIRIDSRSSPLPCVLLTGAISLCIGLLSWHHICDKYLKSVFSSALFLDKACIHQTDITLKTAGIKSIGSILSNSRHLLVAWDPTYFSRLWCSYEMSAYMFAQRGRGSVVVIPVALGRVLLSLILGDFFGSTLWEVCTLAFKLPLNQSAFIYVCCWFLMALVYMFQVSAYLSAVAVLDDQLSRFSIRHCHCFCCQSNHVNPADGSHLPCDRKLVYNSIVHWQGADSLEDGLESFDRMIRGTFKSYVRQAMGSAASLPYRYAVAAGTISMLASLDKYYGFPHPAPLKTDYWIILNAVNWQFLCQPINIGVVMSLVQTFSHVRGRWCRSSQFVGVAGLGASLYFIQIETKKVFFATMDWKTVVYVIIEVCLVWWLFGRERCKQKFGHGKQEQLHSELEMSSFFPETSAFSSQTSCEGSFSERAGR